jgi:hypothetical protein
MRRLAVLPLVAMLCLGTPAFAQPAPTPEEVSQAQARWSEGKAFYDAGNYESARVAFKQAYTIFQHPAFLQNLGEAELRCGRTVEAARHLSQFIRSGSVGSPLQRDAAKKSLKKASEKLGSIVVETNSEDAEVRVDDELVGRSPLGSLQWFVEPGSHLVTAHKEGFLDGSEKVDVGPGPPRNVLVKLQRVVGGPSDSQPAGPAAASSPQPEAPSPPSDTAAPDTQEKKASGMEPRTMVLIGGAALTVVAFGLAGFYATQVSGDESELTAAQRAIPPVAGRLASQWCAPAPPASAYACDHVSLESRRLERDQNVRNGMLIAGSVLAAGTVVTFFLWPNRPSRGPAVSLEIDPFRSGLSVHGAF